MKISKIFAAGIAATMAVTSLAAVASAEETRTFNMGTTVGKIKFSSTNGKEVALLADKDGLAPDGLKIAADDTLVIDTTNADKKVTGVKLNVTGIKGSKSSSSKTYTYSFNNHKSAPYNWTTQVYNAPWANYWVLNAYAGVAPADGFAPNQFVEVTKVEIVIEAESEVTSASVYDTYGSSNWGENINGLQVTNFATAAWGAGGPDILYSIGTCLNAWGPGTSTQNLYAGYSEKSVSVNYPFMAVTDLVSGDKDPWNAAGKPDWYTFNDDRTQVVGDNTLNRWEIFCLSSASATRAGNIIGYKYVNKDKDGKLSNPNPVQRVVYDGDYNQSYETTTYNEGTAPNAFAGLASQVADFFNKQTNGVITFKFTTAAASTGTSWVTGGVPSTQVGVKNVLGDATPNDFVLFVNYQNSTGSLQAVTSIDADAGEVSFDISDILDAMDGRTIGVVENLYYGLTKGIKYSDIDMKGLLVEEIRFSYDEDASSDADIEDDAPAAAEPDEDEDEDDTPAILDDDDEDEDDAPAVMEPDDEDDNNVGGSVVVVTPADDDANPGTGVALAIVPAVLAGAAVVISKKRK